MLVLLVSTLALAADPAAAVTPAPVVPLDPVVVRALSAHDGVDCATLPVAGADDLARYAQPDLAPASVPVRAVGCLVARYPTAVAGIAAPWMTDPTREGLVLTVLSAMDSLPETDAVALGVAALSSPVAPRCGRMLKRSAHPAVRALLVPVAPTP